MQTEAKTAELSKASLEWLDLVPGDWVSVLELHERFRCRLTPSTVRRHLDALVDAGLLERRTIGTGMMTSSKYRRP